MMMEKSNYPKDPSYTKYRRKDNKATKKDPMERKNCDTCSWTLSIVTTELKKAIMGE
jgi:hypothetical protein